jgi:hypothetical protein
MIFVGAIGAAFLLIGGLAASAALLPSATGASISSDKTDYRPGATVTLAGSGWSSGEQVHIVVNDTIGQTWKLQSGLNGAPADPLADTNGAFTYVFDLPDTFISDYDVTATGPISGTATATFTDAVTSTLEQCDNGAGPLKAACKWITGAINAPSAYREGDAVAFRTFLDGLVPGSTNTITIDYNFTKKTNGGKIVLGYDFLTSPDSARRPPQSGVDSLPGGVDLTTAECNALTQRAGGIPSDTYAFPALSGQNSGLSGKTVAGRETSGRQVYIYGADATAISASSITKVNDPVADSNSDSRVTFTFHVPNSGEGCTTDNHGNTACAVEIMWGGHLAKGTTDTSGWGTNTGSSDFPGSSLSMTLQAVNGDSSGTVNRSINPAGIIPPGDIVITKVTTPNASDPQDFGYQGSGAIGNFTLDTDTSDSTWPNTQTFTVLDGGYTVTENNPLPAGWTLSDLTCTDPTSNTTTSGFTATIALAPGETVSCTYTNALSVTPTVTTAIHAGSDHTTNYDGSSLPLNSTIHDKVTVSGSAGTPTGNVTVDFFKNGTCSGTADSTSSSTALSGGSVDITGFAKGPLDAGDYSFKAHYAGATPYVCSEWSVRRPSRSTRPRRPPRPRSTAATTTRPTSRAPRWTSTRPCTTRRS